MSSRLSSARPRVFLVIVAAVIFAAPLRAQGSSYVGLQDAAYRDLDLLISAGVVRDVIVGERPYSRLAFSRFVREAASSRVPARSMPRVTEAMARLAERFGGDRAGAAGLRFDGAQGTLAWSDAPARWMRPGTLDDSLDALLEPLAQRNGGRVVPDGASASVEVGGHLDRWIFGVELTGRGYVGIERGGSVPVDADLVTGAVRAVVGPLAVDAGRSEFTTGFGLHGGPMFSDNARALDQLRLRFDRPYRLPSVLKYLGAWQGSALMADLGTSRDIPGSTLFAMRLSAKPSAYVEFGMSYVNIHGGKGAPPSTHRTRMRDIFYFWQDGGFHQISDKVAGLDVRFAWPQVRAALYANFLTTDDRGRFKQPAGGYWEDAIWQVGFERFALGSEGRLDLRVEAQHTGPRPHAHGQFTSGVTVDNRVIGQAMGPNSEGVTLELAHSAARSRWTAALELERYSGDDFVWTLNPGGGPWDYDWHRIADNPDEIRRRVSLTRDLGDGDSRRISQVRIAYEHASRFGFGPDARSGVAVAAVVRLGR